MDRFFYKFGATTETGRAFIRLWHLCTKAERAADVFAAKVGAKSYYPAEEAFAGGLLFVSFEGDVPPRPNLWRSVGRDADGMLMWEPDVERRSGVVVLAEGEEIPRDSATRVYEKRVTVNGRGERVCRYLEFYRNDIPVDKGHPNRKLPYYVRESFRIERGRMKLPIVRTEELLSVLKADVLGGVDANRPAVVRLVTPTFYRYGHKVYLGCAYPCRAEGMVEIGMEEYVEIEKEVRLMMREAKALGGKEKEL